MLALYDTDQNFADLGLTQVILKANVIRSEPLAWSKNFEGSKRLLDGISDDSDRVFACFEQTFNSVRIAKMQGLLNTL